MINAASSPGRPDADGRRIEIRLADPEGWDLVVELDGDHILVEHYNDWRRVERRLTRLAARTYPSALTTVAAYVVAALLLPGAVFAGQIPAPGSSASATVSGEGLLPEPRLLTRGIDFAKKFDAEGKKDPNGFYVDFGRMMTGAGWISAGPGFRDSFWRDRALVDVSGAVSWRAYKIARARFELPHLARNRVGLGAQAFWGDFTQVRYFGVGMAPTRLASDYRMQAVNVVGYGTYRPTPAAAVLVSGGWLSRPGFSSSTGPFDRDEPDTLQLYAQDPGAALARQPRYAHGDLSFAVDTRDEPSHATRGGVYRAAWAGYRDTDTGAFSFRRYEAEVAQFVPLAGNRWVLAARGWTVLSDTGPGRTVPFYFLPSLGGGNTLRAYSDYRFHDRHLLVANLESRFALFTHVDAAFFIDAGSVAARARDLDFGRTSYGIGVRVHTGPSTLGRLDIARGDEGWRFVFKTSDPLRLGRLSRRTAALPFVP